MFSKGFFYSVVKSRDFRGKQLNSNRLEALRMYKA